MLCGGHDTTQDRRAARGTWPHPSASGVLASLPLRVLLVITPSSVLPLPFHFIHLALRRTTTSLWYVPRARRYTGASSVATLSRASPPFWNECFLRSHSSPSFTKTIPHLARTACFIIILLITFCHDPATDHRLFRDPYPFREIISYLADNTWRPQHCMFVCKCSNCGWRSGVPVFEGCLRTPPTFSTSTFPCL